MNIITLIKQSPVVNHTHGGDENTLSFATYEEAAQFHRSIYNCENNSDFGLIMDRQSNIAVSLQFKSYVESNAFFALVKAA